MSNKWKAAAVATVAGAGLIVVGCLLASRQGAAAPAPAPAFPAP